MPEAATLTPETTSNAEGQAAAEATQTVAPTTPQGAATPPTQQQAPLAAAPQTGEKPPATAPVTYAFKAPEGRAYDPKALSAFEALAQKAALKPEVAQELLDSVAQLTEQRTTELVNERREAHLKAIAADPEMGGANLQANQAKVQKAFALYGPDPAPLLKELKESGAEHLPELNRWALRVAGLVSEDGFVTGRAAPGELTDAKKLYPNHA